MTTNDLLDLARAVVALPGWRWMPGMRDADGRAVLAIDARGVPTLWTAPGMAPRHILGPEFDAEDAAAIWGELLPDLADAATGGCMLSMLGPCTLTTRPGQVWITRAPGVALAAEPYPTLVEACARVALARGGWPT